MDNERLVRVLKALSDANRFRMVQEIASAGQLNCGQIGERFELAQPTISHHLKILAESGVLVVRRQGQHAHLSVNHALLGEAMARLPRRPRVRSRRAPRRRAG